MNNNTDITIPTLAVFRCGNREHEHQVAPTGSQILCQACVNEFLSRNVGLMAEDVADDAPEGFGPPRVESDGTG